MKYFVQPLIAFQRVVTRVTKFILAVPSYLHSPPLLSSCSLPSSLLHHAFLIITSCFSHYYIIPSSLLHHYLAHLYLCAKYRTIPFSLTLVFFPFIAFKSYLPPTFSNKMFYTYLLRISVGCVILSRDVL